MVGFLTNDTEIHVAPPLAKAHTAPLMYDQRPSLKSIFLKILNQHLHKSTTEHIIEEMTSLKLRILPIEEKETFHRLAMEINSDNIIQPYTAFISDIHQPPFHNGSENWIGSITHAERTSFFSVNFVKCSQTFAIFPNAIYLTDILLRQLKLHIKQHTAVILDNDSPPTLCESLSFFTFVQVKYSFLLLDCCRCELISSTIFGFCIRIMI